MKPKLSSRRARWLVELILFVSIGHAARASIIIDANLSFSGVSISASSGNIIYTQQLTTSAYGQAGANGQYNAGASSSASASDTPVPGGSAAGSGSAASATFGTSTATGNIPGNTPGFDTSTGQASASGVFEIVNTTGPVTVTFSADLSGNLMLQSDPYGIYGRAEDVFALSLNGTPQLFYDNLLTIGANQFVNQDVSQILTGMMTLMPNTPYYLYGQADSEAMVVNGVAAVPEPACGAVIAAGFMLALSAVSLLRRRRAAAGVLLVGGLAALWPTSARANYIGSEPPNTCPTCGTQPNRLPGGTLNTSVSEGTIVETYMVGTVKSDYGATMPFALTYNSYNADGSRAQLATGLGFGWTHNYNSILFQQRGQMFRLGADGRVTQYQMNYSGSGGTYTSAAGYFETLTKQPDGTFYVTNKYQSWWHFGVVPNSPFLIQGPVYQLLQMGDRNQNSNTLSYNASGLVANVTDPYGRTLQFTYNSSSQLSSVTDPLGRTTTFQYDSQNRELTQITDPMGSTIQYTYNAQYQMTRKVDRDGRMYFYTYKNLMPFMVTDGSGQPYFSMSNPNNWAVNQSNLAFNMQRQYIPSTTSSTDGRSNTWQYAYDTNGYVTQVTAPDGSTTRYTYDPATLKIASMTDADNHATTYQYDSQGNRTSMTDALGNVTTWTYDPLFSQITSMTDPNDRTTTYNYDTHGNLILSTDPLGQKKSWTYDAHGNVLSMTDKRDYTTSYQYDAFGNLSQMTDPLNNVTVYDYDVMGNRLGLTDANSHTTSYVYDKLDRLIQTTDPLGYTITVTYDAVGDVLSTTDANGHTTTYGYDVRDRRVARTNAVGGVSQWAYDANDNVITRTDEDNHTSTNSYDSQNRLIGITDPLGHVSSTAYDSVGNLITATDANNHASTYGYDALNRKISVTDPLGNTTTYDYASTGGLPCCGATGGSDLITEMVDANNKITYYDYDELNRRTDVLHKSGGVTDAITPSDAVTTTMYDADNNAIAVTDPNGNTTTTTYDALNRRTGMTNAAGDVSTWTYDAVGNVVQTVDPRGDVTSSLYDADNRLIKRTDSIGAVVMNSYDGVGNVTSATDGNGNSTTTAYDAINRVTGVTDPLGHVTTSMYDAVGNPLATTDRNGNITRYMYDADNRRLSTRDALGNISTTAYDSVGNVISMTDPLTHATQYQYDSDNRLIQETYPDTPSDTRTYGYDGTGRVISRLDQNGHTTTYQYNDFYYMTSRQYSVGPSDQFSYDLGGRLTSATRNGWTDNFTYDEADRVLTAVQNGQSVTYSYVISAGIRTITYPSGMVVAETNDLRSRLMTVNNGAAPVLSQFTYDLNNNALTRAYRNGTAANYSYNANNWITSLAHTNASSTLIAGFAYAYDNEGNRTYQMNQTVPTDSEGYSYDALYRLTNFGAGTLSGGVVPSPLTSESYNLDAVGNWTSYTSNAVTQTRAYNAANELLTINASSLAYDANGNLINDGQYAYTYDAENRLTTTTRDSDSALVGQFAYDAVGRRIISIVNPSATPATNIFFYDASKIIEEQNAAGLAQATYIYGSGIDDVLTMNRDGESYYYHPNSLFSIEALTDSAGTPVERYGYDAYGEPTVMDGNYHPLPLNAWGTPHSAVTNIYFFTGRQLDEESGLYYYRARHYQPVLGRFLQRDTNGYVEVQNLYEYVRDNPINSADPRGLDEIKLDKERNNLTRAQFDTLLKDGRCKLPDTKERKKVLDNGCIGIAEAAQGQKGKLLWPEEFGDTKCFLKEDQAKDRKCGAGENKIVFSKQGTFKGGKGVEPKPKADGTVDNDAVSKNANGTFNYVTILDCDGKKWYVWANNGVRADWPAMRVTIATFPANDDHYPDKMWCATCKK